MAEYPRNSKQVKQGNWYWTATFYLACFYLLGMPMWAAHEGKDGAFVTAMTIPGAVVILALHIELFSEFSLGPLRARMRETISEANDALEKLRDAAAVISKTSLTQLMAGNFSYVADGLDQERRLKLADGILNNLTEIGVPPHRIAWARAEWDEGIAAIFFHQIRRRFEQGDPCEAKRAAVGKKLRELFSTENGWSASSSKMNRHFFKCYGFEDLDPGVEMCLQEYEYFEKNKEIRNRAEFLKQP